MNVYIYAADLYCEECGEAIQKELNKELQSQRENYDSDEYPAGPYPDGGGESDCPQHCGSGPDCLNAIEFSDRTKVGAWLENELTPDGVEYVREAIRAGGKVDKLWAEFYCDYDL